MNDTPKDSGGSGMNDRVNRLVAVSVAIISVFMGLAKVKDDNINQAMQDSKARMVDTWNEYQSKKIKQHLDEQTAFLLDLQLDALGAAARGKASARRDELNAEVKRYTEESAQLKAQAIGYDKQYETLNFTDDQFDLSDAALSVGLGMLAVTALLGSLPLLGFAWVFIVVGIVEGLSAFLGWGLHPEWLIKLLG